LLWHIPLVTSHKHANRLRCHWHIFLSASSEIFAWYVGQNPLKSKFFFRCFITERVTNGPAVHQQLQPNSCDKNNVNYMFTWKTCSQCNVLGVN
jgi:hypothetical protein